MNAIPSLLTGQLDIWTSAETEKKSGGGRSRGNSVSVYGIQKLRELILELAVRGKLVPQDMNDEPAGELLKLIQIEKAKLVADGKIKKDKPLPPISDEEKPFELPEGWEWVRNGFLFTLRKGRIPKNLSENNIGLPYLDIEALDRGVVRRYTDDDKCPQSNESDILVVCDGSRSGLILDGKVGIIGSTLSVIDTPVFIQSFVRLIFKQGYERLNATMKGAAIPHLDTQKLAFGVIGFPPLAEQHRIVAKVDKLMTLCDQLETQHNNAAKAYEKLVSHLLDTLTQSQNAEDFGANWQRIAAHFDTLFTTETSIDALKQTLLQLAVMGKLVPQDPNDEPASELLKRIQAEKARLVAEGKIKKDKPLPPITEEEKPFKLPRGWEWVRLGTITEIKGGKRVSNGFQLLTQPTPHIYIRVSDMKDGSIDDSDLRYIDSEMHGKISRYIITKDDIYITIVGATIGKCGVVPEKFDQMNLTENAARLIPLRGIEKIFLYKCLDSPICQSQFFDKTKQVGVQKMALNRLASTIIFLPSRAEQIRIITKVDELMILCDQLKSRITQASQLQKKLADVVVEQAIAS